MKLIESKYLKVVLLLCLVLLLASCAPPPEDPSGVMHPKDFIFNTVQFFLMALLVYFMLVLNPAKTKLETHQKFIENLKKNDEVITSSGIFGRVVSVKPEYITVEIASNVKIKVLPKHLQAVESKGSAGGTDTSTSKEAGSGSAKSGGNKKKGK